MPEGGWSEFDSSARKACPSRFDNHKRVRQPIAEFGDDAGDGLSERAAGVSRKANQDNARVLLSGDDAEITTFIGEEPQRLFRCAYRIVDENDLFVGERIGRVTHGRVDVVACQAGVRFE